MTVYQGTESTYELVERLDAGSLMAQVADRSSGAYIHHRRISGNIKRLTYPAGGAWTCAWTAAVGCHNPLGRAWRR